MGALLGNAVFSAAIFFYCLGLIFAVVGYIGPWLEPRSESEDVRSVGVSKACFREYEFANFNTRNDKEYYDGCFDTTKTSANFDDIPDQYVSPAWYRKVQDMHLASLILIFVTLLLVIGFLISYCTLKQQLKKRRRPSSTLLLSKAALGLWFILALIAGALLLSAPLIFIKNYEADNGDFFLTNKVSHKYGSGLGITIAGGISLLISFILDLVVFVTVIKKMCRLSSGDAKDEFATLGADDTEMERLSNDELDEDHIDSKVTHKKAYPVAAPRKAPPASEEIEGNSYQNIPKSKSDKGGESHQNIHTPRPKSSVAPQPAKRLSTHEKRGAAEPGYKADYSQPSRDRSPAAGNRSVAGESMASTAYPPSTHYSSYSPFMQSKYEHSDTESSVAGRNKSVVRSAPAADNISAASSNVPRPTVVPPPTGRPDAKHSRYAGAF